MYKETKSTNTHFPISNVLALHDSKMWKHEGNCYALLYILWQSLNVYKSIAHEVEQSVAFIMCVLCHLAGLQGLPMNVSCFTTVCIMGTLV